MLVLLERYYNSPNYVLLKDVYHVIVKLFCICKMKSLFTKKFIMNCVKCDKIYRPNCPICAPCAHDFDSLLIHVHCNVSIDVILF